MRLFVGLGNPGAKYAQNRHNIGFMAVEEIARRHGFAPWRRRFQGETSEGTLDRERVVLLENEKRSLQNSLDQLVTENAKLTRRINETENTLANTRTRLEQIETALATVTDKGDSVDRNELIPITPDGEPIEEINMGGGYPAQSMRNLRMSRRFVFAQIMERFGRIDVLVNNAAVFVLKGLEVRFALAGLTEAKAARGLARSSRRQETKEPGPVGPGLG